MLSGYMIDFTEKKVPHRLGPVDERGIPLFDLQYVRLRGAPVYHPIVVIQYGMAHHDLALRNHDSSAEAVFFRCVRWVEDHAAETAGGKFLAWFYPFRLLTPPVSPPWISGMAQGQALSLLIRSYQRTNSPRTAEVASRAAQSFLYPVLEGGILSKTPNGNYFVEELACLPAIQILNGCLYALLGLYEYLTVFPDSRLQEVLKKGIQGVEEALPSFDLGWWSRYSLGIRWNMATLHYHDLHIEQLRYLGEVFRSAVFQEYSLRWAQYRQVRGNTTKRHILGAFELIANRFLGATKLNSIKYRTVLVKDN